MHRGRVTARDTPGRRARHAAALVVFFTGGIACTGPASAQALNAQGVYGGLSIPSARPMGEGRIEFGIGNAREPQLGERPQPRSYVLGVGLLPGLDFVGRFAEYATRHADGGFIGGTPRDGISDLSVNVKYGWRLGPREDAPRIALGLQDGAGGGQRFRTGYLVGTQPFGAFELTLGYGASRAQIYAPGRQAALDGVFGGASWRLPAPAALGDWTLAAEHDGRQAVAGARWSSAPLDGWGGLRLNAALMRSGAGSGDAPGASSWMFGVALPIGDRERQLAASPPPAPTGRALALPAQDSPPARMSALKARLSELGLERVRVGRLPDGAWLVSYQNRRFAQNEVDALGIVLGLAAHAAPPAVTTLVAQSLKSGQPVLTVRADAAAWRQFVQDGNPAAVRAGTRFQQGDALAGTTIDWVSEEPSAGTWLQLQLSPEISYVIGTEWADFDYSLAARVLATVPLWRGAQVVAAAQKRVARSDNVGPDRVFFDLEQDDGLQALALQQSMWVRDLALVGATVGRFEHGALGVEAEAVVFVPARDDVVTLRGRKLERKPQMARGADQAQSASYRWVPTASTWLEVGAQRYSDGSQGPTAVLTRWWGDVGVHLFYRRGGQRQFAGVEFSFPLTPRAAPVLPAVQIGGSPSYTRGVRTRLLDSNTRSNFIDPRRVRDLQLTWDLEVQALNAGRLGTQYLQSQFPRMREAFQLYAVTP